jgi:hypothetical protein
MVDAPTAAVTDNTKTKGPVAIDNGPDNASRETALTSPSNSAIVTSQRSAGGAHDSLPSVTIGAPPALDRQTLAVVADTLHDALKGKNESKAETILTTLSAEDRTALAKVYAEKFDSHSQGSTAIMRDISALGGADAQKLIAVFNRRDGHTNDAGQLAYDLQGLKAGDKSADQQVRDLFAVLNHEQMAQLAKDFRNAYGRSFTDSINSTPGISDETKQALGILTKGTDQRTASDNVALANLAIANKDMDLLQIALRGDDLAGTASLLTLQKNSDFVQRMNDAFGDNKNIANDILQEGHISLETIANGNNAGYFGGSNIKNVELALQKASVQERRWYQHGRELVLSNAQPTDLQGQHDLAYYQKIHRAMENLATGQTPSPDLYSESKPNTRQYLQDKLGINADDLQRYQSDPPDSAFRKGIDQKAATLTAADQFLTRDLLQRLQKGQDIGNLTPEEKLLHDSATHASSYRTLLDAEALVQSDAGLRARLQRINDDPNGAAANYVGNREGWSKDNLLAGIMRQGIHDGYFQNGGSEHSSNPEQSYLSTLLDHKQFSPVDLAQLGFPRDVVQQREQGVPQAEVRGAESILGERGFGLNQNSDKLNSQVTKWDDDIIRGGSMIGQLADHHGSADDIMTTIEHLSKTDWHRAHDDPHQYELFRQDLSHALDQFSSDKGVRDRALALFDDKAKAGSYELSQQNRRSVLDVPSGNPSSMVESVFFMNPKEQIAYRSDNPPGTRQQIDEKVSHDLNGYQQVFVRDMLANLREKGTIPQEKDLSPQDKLFYDAAQGASSNQIYNDLVPVLQDANLRQQLSQDPRLGYNGGIGMHSIRDEDPRVAAIAGFMAGSVGDIVGHAHPPPGMMLPDANAKPYMAEMLSKGSLSLNSKIMLGFSQVDVMSDIAKLPEDQQQGYLDRMQLNGDQQKLAEQIIAEGGNVTLADRLRSFALDDRSKYSDFTHSLQELSPQQLQDLKNEYAHKYGSDLDSDFLGKVDGKDKSTYEALLTPVGNDGRQFYFDALGRVQQSESGYSQDATLQTAQRSLQLYAEALQHASSNGLPLSAEQQAQLMQFFEKGLEQRKESKADFAEKLLKYGEGALLVGATLVALAASDGTISPLVATAIGGAGIALDGPARIAVLKAVEGNDFDGSKGNILKQMGIGVVDGVLNFAPIVGGIGAKLAEKAAVTAVDRTAIDLGLDGVKSKALRENLQEALQGALSKGRGSLTEDEAKAVLRKSGIDGDSQPATVQALRKEAQASAEGQAFGHSLEEYSRTHGQGIPEATGPAQHLGGGVTSKPWEHGQIVRTPEGKVFVINEATKSFDVFDSAGVISKDKLTDLRNLVNDAARNADDPATREMVKNTFIDALNDHSINFRDLRNLMDGHMDPPSAFDFVRVKYPETADPDFVTALQQRARYEVEHNPNVFTDNKEQLEKIFNDLRNGGDPEVLKQDIVNAINRDLTPEEKAAALEILTKANHPFTEAFLKKLDKQFGTESTTSIKEFATTLQKAVREDTLFKKPWYEVEHTGDSFRFRTSAPDVKDIPDVVRQMVKNFEDNNIQILQVDANALLKPRSSGWRSVFMDVRYPNGEIVEYQITPKALADVPKNHADYKWLREHPLPKTKQEIEMQNQILEHSNRVFGEAWAEQLKHDGLTNDQVQTLIDQIYATTPRAY